MAPCGQKKGEHAAKSMDGAQESENMQDALEDAYAAWEAAEFAAALASLDRDDYAGRLRLVVDTYRRRFSPAYFAGSTVARWAAGLDGQQNGRQG